MGLKLPPYTIRQWDNTDPDFYMVIGPYLSRREVVAELGHPVWDDDEKVWLVASTEDEVMGFVSVKPAGAIESLYVLPDSRGESVGAALIHRILSLWPNGRLNATATQAAVELFRQFGFIAQRERGRYTIMELTERTDT